MNLELLTGGTKETKPWLSIVADSLDCVEMAAGYATIEGKLECKELVADSLSMGDDSLIETDDIIVNNSASIGGIIYPSDPGLPGQVLVTDGAANSFWSTNGPPTARSSIIYQQGGVDSDFVVSTWAAVVSLINLNDGFLDVYVDDSFGLAAVTQNVDCQGRTSFFSALNKQVGLRFEGFSLTNPALFSNLALSFNISTPGLITTINREISLSNSSIDNVVSSTSVVMNIVLPTKLILHGDCAIGGVQPIFNVYGGSPLTITSRGNNAEFKSNTIIGDGFSSILINADASFKMTAQVGFLGPVIDTKSDRANRIEYSDAANAVTSLGVNTQIALDQIKDILTANRDMPGNLTLNNNNILAVGSVDVETTQTNVLKKLDNPTVRAEDLSIGTAGNDYKVPNTKVGVPLGAVLQYNGTDVVFKPKLFGSFYKTTATNTSRFVIAAIDTWTDLSSTVAEKLDTANLRGLAIDGFGYNISHNDTVPRLLQVNVNLSVVLEAAGGSELCVFGLEVNGFPALQIQGLSVDDDAAYPNEISFSTIINLDDMNTFNIIGKNTVSTRDIITKYITMTAVSVD